MSSGRPSFPLQFTTRVGVQRAEYAASVEIAGSAVAVYDPDDGGYVVHGVQPGGFVGFGRTLQEACDRHSQRLPLLLDDILHEADSYSEFERRTQGFFGYVSPWAKEQFEDAYKELCKALMAKDEPFSPPQMVADYSVPQTDGAYSDVSMVLVAQGKSIVRQHIER